MVKRSKREYFKRAVDLFVLRASEITGVNYSKYKCNDNDVACFNNFWSEYENLFIGDEFLNKFTEFQLNYFINEKDHYKAEKTNRFKIIRFSWIFSGEAVKRWKDGDVSVNIWRVRKNSNHKRKAIFISDERRQMILNLRAIEEYHKSKYYGTDRGLRWCIANTTLFNHKSSLCAACLNKVACIEIQKKELTKVYEIRNGR